MDVAAAADGDVVDMESEEAAEAEVEEGAVVVPKAEVLLQSSMGLTSPTQLVPFRTPSGNPLVIMVDVHM